MIRNVVLGWLAASGLFLLGWWARSTLDRTDGTPDPDHNGCQQTIGRLSAENQRLRRANIELAGKVNDAFEFGRMVQHEHEENGT